MIDVPEVIKLDGGVYDFHCHLRSGAMMRTLARLHYEGGVRVALVMPNLEPPILTGRQALDYEKELMKAEPRLKYLKTIYLTEELTQMDIRDAFELGVRGVKLYPSGVTTNSESGIKDINKIYNLLKEMDRCGMVLNVHGECISKETTPLTAEENFLPKFEKICCDFPTLKIVFEHCTTKKAVDLVNSLGSNVVSTITLHHLQITSNDWVGKNYGINYCKPVAKLPIDREHLRKQVLNNNKKFFLGTDSAPHTELKKKCEERTAAGIYTGASVIAYAAHILENFGALDNLKNFCQSNGARFYDIETHSSPVLIQRAPNKIPENIYFTDITNTKQAVTPFMAGEELRWRII